MSQARHIAIAAGGTGGHFYPALAIAQELAARGHRVTMLVSGQHAGEHLAMAQRLGLAAVTCPSHRLSKKPLELLLFPARFLAACLKMRKVLKQLQADLVLGMGSFAAAPACAGAVLARLPLLLHEANSRPGAANRRFARFAKAMAVSLPLDAGVKLACPTVPTGLPLRRTILDAAATQPPPRAELCSRFGLDPARRTLLVFGGSQGARAVNALLRGYAQSLGPAAKAKTGLQVIHLTGQENNVEFVDAYAMAGIPACVKQRDEQIQFACQLADLAICRAGASSVSELALFRLPAIFIPLPGVSDDHQTANARAAIAAGGGVLLPQAEAVPKRLGAILEPWLNDPESWRQKAGGLATLAIPAAAAKVADLVEAQLP
jgi:UDP-N-acetylglucosamine--N-acetylmuramyl-(pentapeptide) pyrophosphoryl-undecaprenol N-acetylglucosamine transferase